MSNKKVGREKSICLLRRLQYTGQSLLPLVTFVHIKILVASFSSSVYMRGGGGGQWTLGVAFSSMRNHLIAIFEVLMLAHLCMIILSYESDPHLTSLK